jgi:hypothetical protein
LWPLFYRRIKIKVSVTFHDNTSLSPDEVVSTLQKLHGKNASIVVSPDSTTPHDLILFGIQQIISTKQFSLIYDDSHNYQTNIKLLRSQTLHKLEELLDEVIIDNESKLE